jgi:hypothetical protein
MAHDRMRAVRARARGAPITRTLATAVAVALLAGCQLLQAEGRPTIFLTAPEGFAILAEAPSEITGIAFGRVQEIELTVDGERAGRPLAGETDAAFRLPIARTLTDGLHTVRAVAIGPEGTASDSLIFAIGTQPFLVGFVPERLVIDRTTVGPDPVAVRLGLLGPRVGDGYEVSLVVEADGGLIYDVFPFDAFESTGGFPAPDPEPIETGLWVLVDLSFDRETPVGEHQLVVRADGPAGTESQRATLTVEVTDGPAPPTQQVAAPGAAHDERYRVRSRVTASDTPGVGSRADATWRLEFGCADGRCDAVIHNGGPRGGMDPLTARYAPDEEAYRFEVTLSLAGESCPEQRLTGEIAPESWDDRGPVRFRYRLDGVIVCDRADIHVTWEGTGRRL